MVILMMSIESDWIILAMTTIMGDPINLISGIHLDDICTYIVVIRGGGLTLSTPPLPPSGVV